MFTGVNRYIQLVNDQEIKGGRKEIEEAEERTAQPQ